MTGILRFSRQVFENADRFLNAAEHLLEPRPDDSGARNVLLFPSYHCAVLACEMFLKSVMTEENSKAPKDEVGILEARPKGKHKDLFLQLPTGPFKAAIEIELSEEDHKLITYLDRELTRSRYPYENAGTRPNDHPLRLARKLRKVILSVLVPDGNGNIPLN